ncbi:hypothetical protein RJ55_04909 [Drechmeria coniospora]|nr:hypothetical protein RJ55_04909 [Drechmeria coniospora]
MHPILVSFPLSLFFVSVVTTKTLRLFLNAHSFSLPVFTLFLPVFVLTDIVLICTLRLLLRRSDGLRLLGFTLAIVTSLVTFGAATSKLSFFWQTGGEIDWSDTSSFAFTEEGLNVLLSGLSTAITVGAILFVISWIIKNLVNRAVATFIEGVEIQFTSILRFGASRMGWRLPGKREDEGYLLPLRQISSSDGTDEDDDNYEDDEDMLSSEGTLPVDEHHMLSEKSSSRRRLVLSCVAGTILVAFVVNVVMYPDLPYTRVLTTLPLPLLGVFRGESQNCYGGSWPYPELISKSRWEMPNGYFKGWAPGADNKLIRKYRQRRPSWLPDPCEPRLDIHPPVDHNHRRPHEHGSTSDKHACDDFIEHACDDLVDHHHGVYHHYHYVVDHHHHIVDHHHHHHHHNVDHHLYIIDHHHHIDDVDHFDCPADHFNCPVDHFDCLVDDVDGFVEHPD